MSDGGNGWARAYDQLSRRVDAVENAVKALAGRPADAPPPSEQEVKVGGVGVGTWITLLATIVVPIVVAVVATGGLR